VLTCTFYAQQILHQLIASTCAKAGHAALLDYLNIAAIELLLLAGRRIAGGKGTTAGPRPGTAGVQGRSNVSHADGAMAALSRQLVQAKMAEADAQRKHRHVSVCQKLPGCIGSWRSLQYDTFE